MYQIFRIVALILTAAVFDKYCTVTVFGDIQISVALIVTTEPL